MKASKFVTLAVVATVLEAQDGAVPSDFTPDEKNHPAISGIEQVHEHDKEVPSPIYCGPRGDGVTVCLELAHMHPLRTTEDDEQFSEPV